MKQSKTNLHICIPSELHDALRETAQKNHVAINDIVTDLIYSYIYPPDTNGWSRREYDRELEDAKWDRIYSQEES